MRQGEKGVDELAAIHRSQRAWAKLGLYCPRLYAAEVGRGQWGGGRRVNKGSGRIG